MKKFTFTILFSALSVFIFAQTIVDFGIYMVSPDNYAIRAKADNGGLMSAPFNLTTSFSITIRWQTTDPVMVSGVSSPLVPSVQTTSNSNSSAGPTAGYTYTSFLFNGPLNISLPGMTEVDMVTFSNTMGGEVVMELMDNAEIPTDIALNLGQSYVALGPPSENYGVNFRQSTAPNLPVELSHFTAKPVDRTDGLLSWTTAVEVNADYFELQRSRDGESWEAVGKVQAVGNSTFDNSYTFLDKDVYELGTGKETYYYRIKTMDNDQSYKLSEVRSITFNSLTNDAEVNIYPNPTSTYVKVNLSDSDFFTDEELTYRLIDVSGKFVLQGKIESSPATIQLGEVVSGTYILEGILENGEQVFKEAVEVFKE